MSKTDLSPMRRKPGRPRRRAPVQILGYQDGIPIVPVTVERYRGVNLLQLAACPYCGEPHTHGGGRADEDPHDLEGHRVSHCVKRVPGDRGYILRIAEGEAP